MLNNATTPGSLSVQQKKNNFIIQVDVYSICTLDSTLAGSSRYSAIWTEFSICNQLQLSVFLCSFSVCKTDYCGSKVLIRELKQCNLLLKLWCWMEWAYVRWADGRLDKAGGVLDGQTGGRAPRRIPQCLVTVPHGMRCHLFPALHPHVSPTCKQTRTRTNTPGSWFGWEMRKRQSLPSVVQS